MAGPVIGPALGGWLTEILNWRYVFFVNIPVGVLAWIGISTTAPSGTGSERRPLDWFGFAVLAGAIGLGQLALDRGNQLDWFNSDQIKLQLLIAAVLWAMFAVHMLTAPRPFMERPMFRDRNFVLTSIFMMLLYVLILVPSVLVPLFMQQLMGVPVIDAGLALAPRGLGIAVGMFAAAPLVRGVGIRWTAVCGALLCCATTLPLAHVSLDTSLADISTIMTLQGFGLGVAFGVNNHAMYSTLPIAYRAEASAFSTLIRYMAGAFFVAMSGAWLLRLQASNRSRLAESITPWTGSEILTASPPLPTELAAAVLDAELNRQASVIAFDNLFFALLFIGVACIPVAALFSRRAAG